MNKKVVVITLLLITVFTVGGVLMQTHGEGDWISIGSFHYADYVEGWGFTVNADANGSGANTYASPVLINIRKIIEAATESGIPINLSGYATAYVKIYIGKNPQPKYDSGKIYAKLEVTVESEWIDNYDGTSRLITVKTGKSDSKGRHKYKGGGEYIAKDSGVCGNFGPWSSFSDYAKYRYN